MWHLFYLKVMLKQETVPMAVEIPALRVFVFRRRGFT